MGLICLIDQIKGISKIIVSTCGCFEIFHIGHLE
jgi:glycerol-3-phosphate cytidylyltransferase-like family protein